MKDPVNAIIVELKAFTNTVLKIEEPIFSPMTSDEKGQYVLKHVFKSPTEVEDFIGKAQLKLAVPRECFICGELSIPYSITQYYFVMNIGKIIKYQTQAPITLMQIPMTMATLNAYAPATGPTEQKQKYLPARAYLIEVFLKQLSEVLSIEFAVFSFTGQGGNEDFISLNPPLSTESKAQEIVAHINKLANQVVGIPFVSYYWVSVSQSGQFRVAIKVAAFDPLIDPQTNRPFVKSETSTSQPIRETKVNVSEQAEAYLLEQAFLKSLMPDLNTKLAVQTLCPIEDNFSFGEIKGNSVFLIPSIAEKKWAHHAARWLNEITAKKCGLPSLEKPIAHVEESGASYYLAVNLMNLKGLIHTNPKNGEPYPLPILVVEDWKLKISQMPSSEVIEVRASTKFNIKNHQLKPLHVNLLLDTSTSMRMKNAVGPLKEGIIKCFRLLHDSKEQRTIKITLNVFNEKVTTVIEKDSVSSSNLDRLIKQVESLQTADFTNICGAFDVAIKQLDFGYENVIILMTDGLSTVPRDQKEFAEKLTRTFSPLTYKNVPFCYTVGFSADVSAEQLKFIADTVGGILNRTMAIEYISHVDKLTNGLVNIFKKAVATKLPELEMKCTIELAETQPGQIKIRQASFPLAHFPVDEELSLPVWKGDDLMGKGRIHFEFSGSPLAQQIMVTGSSSKEFKVNGNTLSAQVNFDQEKLWDDDTCAAHFASKIQEINTKFKDAKGQEQEYLAAMKNLHSQVEEVICKMKSQGAKSAYSNQALSLIKNVIKSLKDQISKAALPGLNLSREKNNSYNQTVAEVSGIRAVLTPYHH